MVAGNFACFLLCRPSVEEGTGGGRPAVALILPDVGRRGEKGSSTTGGLDGDGGELPREREGGPTPHVHDMLDPVSVKTTQK
jgi:hypothetical protein